MENKIQQYLLDNSNIMQYSAKTVLFDELQICDRLGYIIKGSIQISNVNNNGNKYTIKTIEANELFGESLIFSNNPSYLGSGVCTIETKVAWIKKQTLLQMFQDNSFFLTYYLEYLSNEKKELQKQVKVLSQPSLEDKIFMYIDLEMEQQKKTHIFYNTKEKLSHYLNITRPSLSRKLIEMRKDNKIEFDSHYIWKKSIN